jgi:beta-lactam-binding protein with PASTA domain
VRPSWLPVALGAAGGLLAGVLLVIALGGPTTTTRTVTVPPTASTPEGGTVITTTEVPDVVGERLDIAKQRVRRAGFLVDVSGGGAFGVIQDDNWQVVAQEPSGGNTVERGSTVALDIERG